MSANVKDDCLFMEYKYLWIANICSSLQLDSVIVDQGPTGRVFIKSAIQAGLLSGIDYLSQQQDHKCILSVIPKSYLQKLPHALTNIEAEAYHSKLNIKKKDVDHTSNGHTTLPLYKVSDTVYFHSNRGYRCENTLDMLWQGPIKTNQKMDPVNYTKDPNTGHLITRVHTQYICAAPSTHE
ncbi:hypothetical protein DSO57_1024551 [Entomophthora muscae]|uniref:Uncharacterized protein n=1 Tax=Entomophthora muscae TaxID=34485 RepID=A0ACC2UMY4_9FUNG|nr:hypothetical protein DSO57_1024551 [Entomophthora muscae]